MIVQPLDTDCSINGFFVAVNLISYILSIENIIKSRILFFQSFKQAFLIHNKPKNI